MKSKLYSLSTQMSLKVTLDRVIFIAAVYVMFACACSSSLLVVDFAEIGSNPWCFRIAVQSENFTSSDSDKETGITCFLTSL